MDERLRTAHEIADPLLKKIESFLIKHPTISVSADRFYTGLALFIPSRYSSATHFPTAVPVPLYRTEKGHRYIHYSHHYGIPINIGEDELYLLFLDPRGTTQDTTLSVKLYTRMPVESGWQLLLVMMVVERFIQYGKNYLRTLNSQVSV